MSTVLSFYYEITFCEYDFAHFLDFAPDPMYLVCSAGMEAVNPSAWSGWRPKTHPIIDTEGAMTMEKYVPYEKLSKKKKRELNASRRNTWGNLNPVTRKPDPHKAYNRRKAQKWNDDSSLCLSYI